MIIKSFINLVSFLNISLMYLFLFLINKFLTIADIRRKFFLFVVVLFTFVIIGLYYNLDGIILMFLISELSVILIFITLYSQVYAYNKKNIKNFNNFFFFIIIIFNFQFYDIKLLNYNNYYSYFNINVNDFYYLYNFFFEKHLLATTIIIFLLTIYSIFFILLYFNFKKIQNKDDEKKKSLTLLRKQNLIHQGNYNTKIRIFQNNKI